MIQPSDVSIFVAVPAYGKQVNDQTALSLFRLGLWAGGFGISTGIATLSYPDIVETRNSYVSMWYYNYPNFTHLLFIDADMSFAPELIQDMIVYDKPLIGCFYRYKQDNKKWVGQTINRKGATISELPVMEKGFIPVAAIGMGITLISRTCISRMIEHYPELVHDVPEHESSLDISITGHRMDKVFRCFDKFPMGYANLSEDFSFSKRWRDIGGEIYANIAHPIGHAGHKMFGGSLLEELNSKSKTMEAAE